MANRSVLQIVIETVRKGRGAEQTETHLKKLTKVMAAFTAAATATGVAMKQVYDTAKRGADLERAEKQFDRLAASIGTSGLALKRDLRDAIGGLQSDAQIMAGATDLMALGLVDTHDEAVRMARVVGQLDMDMNQLVLTLTNMTTMRFDALGVQVTGFEDKVKSLEESGLDAGTAFKEAFLQQAEQQIERVGSVADESIGSFMRLEAEISNVGDALLKATNTGVSPFVEGIADRLEVLRKLNHLLAVGAIDVDQWTTRVIGAKEVGWEQTLTLVNQQLEQQKRIFAEIDAEMEGANHILSIYAGNLDDVPAELMTRVDADTSAAEEEINRFKGLLNSINFNILQASHITDKFGTGGAGIGVSGYIAENAAGGSYLLPGRGSGERPYLVSAQPGELMTITPRHEVNNNQQYIFNNNISSELDGQAMVGQLERALRRT